MQLLTAVAAFTVTKSRSDVMSFAHQIGEIYFSLFTQNPRGSLNYMAYIEPMHHMTWLCVGLFCILTPSILFCSNQYVSIIHISVLNSCFKIYHLRYGKRNSTNYEFTIGKSAVFVLSSLTMRGWSDTPITPAARIAFIM